MRRPEVAGGTTYMRTYSARQASSLWLWFNLPLHLCRLFGLRRVRVNYEAIARDPGAGMARLRSGFEQSGGRPTGGSESPAHSFWQPHAISNRPDGRR